jgi:hypothetical protein
VVDEKKSRRGITSVAEIFGIRQIADLQEISFDFKVEVSFCLANLQHLQQRTYPIPYNSKSRQTSLDSVGKKAV